MGRAWSNGNRIRIMQESIVRKVCLLSLVLCGLCAGLAGAAENPVVGAPITYQLPADGPLPKTYRVTLPGSL